MELVGFIKEKKVGIVRNREQKSKVVWRVRAVKIVRTRKRKSKKWRINKKLEEEAATRLSFLVKIKIVARNVGEIEKRRRRITIKIKANLVERDLRIEAKRGRRTIKIGINRSRIKVTTTISGGRRRE
jgi:hypothetical protein